VAGLTPQAMEVMKVHHGVASRSMLRAAGVGVDAQRRAVERGLLVEMYDRVVRIATAPDTVVARCAALCLAFPRAFITGPTEGRLIGLRRMPPTQLVHLSVPHGSNIGPLDGVVLRQTTSIHPSDLQQRRPDGIVLASAPRLAFDLGADLSAIDHASIVEQLLHEQRCTFATLVRTARRLIHPHRPGSVVVAHSLEQRGERAPAESHPEVVLSDALRARGVPVQAQTTWLSLPNGSRIRLDLTVPEIRWAIEIDVHPDHLFLVGTTKDKARDRQCHLIGWEVERVTALDLVDLDGTADELRLLYLARARQHVAA
jgi:hypothetical protein